MTFYVMKPKYKHPAGLAKQQQNNPIAKQRDFHVKLYIHLLVGGFNPFEKY